MKKLNPKLQNSLQSNSTEHCSFARRLKLIKGNETGLSFGARIGVSDGAVRAWLKESEPSRAMVVKICQAFDINLLWLATGEGPMRPGEEVLPPPAWEQEKALLEEKVRDYRHLQEHLKAGKREVEARKQEVEAGNREIERLKAQVFLGAQRENELLKGQVEAGRRENEAGKREIELLKEVAEANRQIHNMERGMVKQLPPPPIAGGGFADMTMLGLAECGLEGWLLKKPLSAKAVCPADMNSAEDFAVIATGQSLFHAGIEPGFTCFCAAKSAPLVGDIVYVLKPSNKASLGLVRELEQKEKGSETPWLVLQKWHDLDPKTGLREPYTLQENRDEIEEIVPVIYVQRRPI